ncbi:LUD domain-containing protein [bacterium]|nr:LUD domain-containing protein [bacterium]
MTPETDDRNVVLARIREALGKRRAPIASPLSPEQLGALLPKVVDSLTTFGKWLEDLGGEFVCCQESELEAVVTRLAGEHGWQRPAIHDFELIRGAIGSGQWSRDALEWEQSVSAEALERCDVGITGCLALIAQTGSVLLNTSTAGGRTLSILPPHQLVIARRAQLMEDLPSAMRAALDSGSSMISLHTGPSRTGDIERVLVLGAHGCLVGQLAMF